MIYNFKAISKAGKQGEVKRKVKMWTSRHSEKSVFTEPGQLLVG